MYKHAPTQYQTDIFYKPRSLLNKIYNTILYCNVRTDIFIYTSTKYKSTFNLSMTVKVYLLVNIPNNKIVLNAQ